MECVIGTQSDPYVERRPAMECGILRIIPISPGGIRHVGDEEDRTHAAERNPDIDPKRSELNLQAIRDDGISLQQAWKNKCSDLGLSISGKIKYGMEQAVITASPEFFKKLGWDPDTVRASRRVPKEIVAFFEAAADWFFDYVGRENVVSATIHFDETSPHMHVDYLPALPESTRRKDVYLKDETGKLLRNASGHAIRAKDEHGKTLYEYVTAPARLSRTDFWQTRGGRMAYRKLQDAFYDNVSKKWGLDRGEIGSDREHVEQARYKAEKAEQESKAAEQALEEASAQIASVVAAAKTDKITDSLQKTLTGKRIVSEGDVEKIDTMQTVVSYQAAELARKESEIRTKEAEIKKLQESEVALKKRYRQERPCYEEYKRKAEYWDILIARVALLTGEIKKVIEKIIQSVINEKKIIR